MHLKNLGFVLLLALCVHANAQTSYNLDMEIKDPATGLPRGWFGKSSTNSHELYIDSISKVSGEYALALTNSNPNATAYATYAIKAKQSAKTLKLTGFIRTEDVNGGYGGLFIHIKADKTYKNNWLQQVNMDGRGLSGTSDWSSFSIEAPYDETMADSIYVGVEIYGTGTVWVDNLSIMFDEVDIASAPAKSNVQPAAKKDTAFLHASGINEITLNEVTTTALTNLGMLWGFIKYHHPAVADGRYNMDAELFRVLPTVLSAKDKSSSNKVLEDWVDKFGKPGKCINCVEIRKEEKTKQMPDYGKLFDQNNLSPTLIDKLAYIRDNRNTGNSYYIYMGRQGAIKPDFRNEHSYEEVTNPDAGLRLLGLYRYWNAVQYFYAGRYLLQDWNKVLPEFIPRFINTKDSVEYLLAASQLVAKVNDSDAGIFAPGLNRLPGAFYPPVQTRFVDNELIVTGYYINNEELEKNIKIGDVIRKVNDKSLEEIVKEKMSFTSASNKDVALRNIRSILLRDKNKTATWEIERDGKISKVNVDLYQGGQLNFSIDKDPSPKEPGYKLLTGNIGYINASKLKNEDLNEIQNAFKTSPGFIIDFRGLASAPLASTIVPWLKTGTSPFASFSYGNVSAPGYFIISDQRSIGRNNEEPYKGKVVVIVNELTQGASEYTIMALQSAPNVTVVGSTTAGADANVSPVYFPGGIVTNISGVGVYYPDGTETQKGLRIDFPVKPTIKGVLEGRDEVLEKAVEVLRRP